MMIYPGSEFLVGIAVRKILLAAVLASPLAPSVSLASAAVAVCVLCAEKGTTGILAFAHWLEADLLRAPDFSTSVVAGAIVAFIVFGILRRRFS